MIERGSQSEPGWENELWLQERPFADKDMQNALRIWCAMSGFFTVRFSKPSSKGFFSKMNKNEPIAVNRDGCKRLNLSDQVDMADLEGIADQICPDADRMACPLNQLFEAILYDGVSRLLSSIGISEDLSRLCSEMDAARRDPDIQVVAQKEEAVTYSVQKILAAFPECDGNRLFSLKAMAQSRHLNPLASDMLARIILRRLGISVLYVDHVGMQMALLSAVCDYLDRIGHFHESVPLYQVAISLYHDNPDLYIRLSNALTVLGRFQEAKNVLKKGLEYSDSDALKKIVFKFGEYLDATMLSSGDVLSSM